jgi:parvulin-like peptidyl-prolyl isomerase
LGAVFGVPTAPAVADDDALPEGIVAVVNGETITQAEFDAFFLRYVRSKFYHAVSPERLKAAKAEAADAMVLQTLLAQEAEKRGLAGDEAKVAAQIAAIESRYQGAEDWPRMKARLPDLRALLFRDTKIEELRTAIRHVAEPSEDELRAYYADNIELFTEPKRDRLSLILVGVEPSQTSEAWAEAKRKTEEMFQQLEAGTSFAELAREQSTHESAERGGDLGYVHFGMLSQSAQAPIDKLETGEFSRPIRLLEGYALFRLEGREPPRRRDFADVRGRALGLYKRSGSEQQWKQFVAGLRNTATVRLDSRLLGGDREKAEPPG